MGLSARSIGTILPVLCAGCGASPNATVPDAGGAADAPSHSSDSGVEAPLAPAVAFLDGTRLKHVHWVADDGYRQQVGEIYDSLLGLECTFRESADGRLRCLPAAHEVTDGHGIYADPECREALGQTGIGHAGPRYVAVVDGSNGCKQRVHYRETGPRFEGAEGFHKVDSACVPRRFPIPAWPTFGRGRRCRSNASWPRTM